MDGQIMKRLAMWMVAGMLALLAQTAGAADVLLGAGDVVKVSVYGNQDLSLETRVSETGTITFPLIGTVELGGLSVAAAEKKIAGMLESGGFIRKAQVNVLVTSLQSAQVSVLGQVNRPGRYPIEGKRTLMDMLALAGGFNADVGRDFEVVGGDILYVERAPRFYIYGEVQRPGPFRLERQMTLLQALSTGGGLTPRGTERGIRIKRRDAKGVLQVIEAKQDDLVQVDDV